MSHMDSDSRAEFELAVQNAWNKGRNDRERTEAFIEAVRDAEQAHRDWASDLLTAALRDGMWKRLKQRHKALEPLLVKFAHSEHNVPSIGGVARVTEAGRSYEQLAFIDMTRAELLAKQAEYENTAFAARRNKYLVGRLIELIDAAEGAATARQAAHLLRLDVGSYLAIEASA